MNAATDITFLDTGHLKQIVGWIYISPVCQKGPILSLSTKNRRSGYERTVPQIVESRNIGRACGKINYEQK